jgi:peptide/nickel transport system ATP-binding protein
MYAGRLVEGGPAEDVTQAPIHPYTRLLLSAAPDPDVLDRGPFTPGIASQPTELADACRPQPSDPRRAYSADAGRASPGRSGPGPEAPARIELENGHWALCWSPDEVSQSGVPEASLAAAASDAWATRGLMGPVPGTDAELPQDIESNRDRE